jgi:hypothetical protein
VEVQEGAVVVVVRSWYQCRKGPSRQRRANSLCVMEMKCCGFDRRSDDGGSSAHCRYVRSPTLPFSPPIIVIVDTDRSWHVPRICSILISTLPRSDADYIFNIRHALLNQCLPISQSCSDITL